MKKLTMIVTLAALALSACGGTGDEARNVAIPSQDALARMLPANSEGIPGERASVVIDSTGEGFCSITSTGALVCWGSQQASVNSYRRSNVPVEVERPTAAPLTAVSTSNSGTCVVTEGDVWCKGNNANRQVDPAGDYGWIYGWRRVNLPFQSMDVTLSVNFSCALGTTGQVACWGMNVNRVLGENLPGNGGNGPYLITNLTDVRKVEIIGTNACAVERDGDVMCWGSGNFGMLGGPPVSDVARPVRVNLPGPAVDMDFEDESACAALSNGSIWCWGKYAPVYSDQTPILVAPQRVQGWARAAVKVDLVQRTTCAVDDSGTVWCWGLVNNTTRALPVAVTDASYQAMDISSAFFQGSSHCIQTWSASVRCFGKNSSDQLGQGPGAVAFSAEPLVVRGLAGVIIGAASVGGTTLPPTTLVPKTTTTMPGAPAPTTTVARSTTTAAQITIAPTTTVSKVTTTIGGAVAVATTVPRTTTTVTGPVSSSAPAPATSQAGQPATSTPADTGGSGAPAGSTAGTTAVTTAPVIGDAGAVAVTTAVERATTSRVNVRVKKGKSVDFRTIVRHAGLVAPKGAKIVVTVPKASKKTCAISGVRLVGAKLGSCGVTVKVTPKGSKARSAVVAVDIVR